MGFPTAKWACCSAFAWSYGLAQIPAGTLIDRFGARRILGSGLILWSLAQIAASFVASFVQFITARAALGLGKSMSAGPVCVGLLFALKDRALPIAIFNSSSALAPAFAPRLLTWLMVAFGWRVMFLIAGPAGFAIAVLWFVFYRSPLRAEHSASQRIGEFVARTAKTANISGGIKYSGCFGFGQLRGILLGFSGVVYSSWLYATWLPGYLEQARHLSMVDAELCCRPAARCGFSGRALGRFHIRSPRARRNGRRSSLQIPTTWGLIAAGSFTVAAALSGNVYIAVGLMACGLFAANVSSSCGWALAAVIAPANTDAAWLESVPKNVVGSIGGRSHRL